MTLDMTGDRPRTGQTHCPGAKLDGPIIDKLHWKKEFLGLEKARIFQQMLASSGAMKEEESSMVNPKHCT